MKWPAKSIYAAQAYPFDGGKIGNKILLVASKSDLAGMNIYDKLLGLDEWEDAGVFEESGVCKLRDFMLTTIAEHQLYRDGIDKSFREKTGIPVSCVVYLSKHRSESNMKSLTVHPIGNFGKAEFGGKEKTLVPSMPNLMTSTLRALKKEAKAASLDYNVSFEATHHGPHLGTPTFYIEIGSSEPEWKDEKAATAITKALLGAPEEKYTVAIGVGGGHYAPRITDVALGNKIAFGHILPSYAVDGIDDSMLEQCLEKTKNAKLAYLHRKAMKKPDIRRLEEWFEGHGIKVVREEELEKIG